MQMVTCDHGHEAVALLEAGHDEFGLIFCDLQMPEMDGVEFVRHLARVGYQGGLVFVSGAAERVLLTAERFGKAHGLKMLTSLQKPVLPETLKQLLDDVLVAVPDACSEAS